MLKLGLPFSSELSAISTNFFCILEGNFPIKLRFDNFPNIRFLPKSIFFLKTLQLSFEIQSKVFRRFLNFSSTYICKKLINMIPKEIYTTLRF